MSCTKDSLYIFLQSGKYTVLYKRFTLYIYTVRKNATSCTMDSLTVVLPTMRAPIIHESSNHTWGIKTAYLIVYTYITLLDNHTVHIQFLNVITLFL